MKNRKTPLTVAEHQQIGLQLHEIYTRALYAAVALSHRLGKSKSLPKHASKAVELLSAARSDLEDVFYRQYRQAFDSHVYYPGTAILNEYESEYDDEGQADYQAMIGHFETWQTAVSEIVRRLWHALPVKERAVKKMEHARDELSWITGSLGIAVGNDEL